jgi:hypothetical protein
MAKLTIRSGLSLDTSNPKVIETVRSCLYEMNRVEEINLTAIPGLILEEIFRDLPKSAPQLHTLCIGSYSFRFVGPAFPIHEDFLYDTERLQRVELTNCQISWDSRLLTGLTHLTLEDSLKANSSIIQILHALQRMPALTNLHLKDSIPDDSEGPSTYPVVDLPCLRALRISSGVGALTTILRHITIPHSAKFNLTCRETQRTQIDFSNFFSVLATKFLSSLVIRSLSLRASDDTVDTQAHGLKFYLWTTVIQDCFPSPSCLSSQSQIQLVLTWPSPQPHNYVKALTCAFDAMRLPFLTQLQISTEDYIDSQTLAKTFGKLPLLKWVCVRDYDPHLFLEALVYKTKAAEKSKAAYRDVSFPKLRYIHLECTDFFGTGPSSISVDMLLDYLMERCERNAEVRVLRLDDCYYFSSDDVERLKEIVVDVIWDGIVQEFSDEDRDYDDDGNTIDDDYDYDEFSSGSEEAPILQPVPSVSISTPGLVQSSSSDERLAAHSPSTSSEDAISPSTATAAFPAPDSPPSSTSGESISAAAAHLLSHSPPSDDHPDSDEESSDGSLDAAIAGVILQRHRDNLRGSSVDVDYVARGPFTAADFDWLQDEWFE